MLYQILVLCVCLAQTKSSPARNSNIHNVMMRLREKTSNRVKTVDENGAVPDIDAEQLLESQKNLNKRDIGVPVSLGPTRKNNILSPHNAARANVIPPASPPMANLTWDNALAAIAQDWAVKCTLSHNPDRSLNYEGYVGENIAWHTGVTTGELISYGVNGWINEKQYWTYDIFPDGCQIKGACSHYTQIIWAKTVRIGCAVADCPSNFKYFVCNYSKGGNFLGAFPYVSDGCK